MQGGDRVFMENPGLACGRPDLFQPPFAAYLFYPVRSMGLILRIDHCDEKIVLRMI